MSITDQDKKRKDKKRLIRLINNNHSLIKEALIKAYSEKPTVGMKVVLHKHYKTYRNKGRHLDTSIVRYLVGLGLVKPEKTGNGIKGYSDKAMYTLTNKGVNVVYNEEADDPQHVKDR